MRAMGEKHDEAVPDVRTHKFHVHGMTCGACVSSIETMLGKQAGILEVAVALLAERATVTYDAAAGWTPEKIVDAIDDIGFDAEHMPEHREDDVTLSVFGMTCASCTSSLERALHAVPGVLSCEASLVLQRVHIHYDHTRANVRALVEAVEGAGFDAVVYDDRDAAQVDSLEHVRDTQDWRRAFVTSLAFAIPNFLLCMVLMHVALFRPFLMAQPVRGVYMQDVLALLLTLPVQFGVGMRFFRAAFKAMKHGSMTMDTLVIVGTMAAWTFSVASMLIMLGCTGEHCEKPRTFFDTSTMLITFVSLGRYLENAAKGRTGAALTRLIQLAPQKATILTPDGGERIIPAELLEVGDMVKLVPGEKIGADGIVRRGHSYVDESMVTGEHVPVAKMPGATVLGGTVNGDGALDFEVTRAGKDTSLSRIVQLVQDAQVSKAPIQNYADRVAGVFVPAILMLSGITLVVWLSVAAVFPPAWQPHMIRDAGPHKWMECVKLCISVIVVACPCALGLSTPTAVMVGTGVGAENGILIKTAPALEAACTVGHVVFDKTGTLTKGQLNVVEECRDAGDESRLSTDRLRALVGAVERRSEHALAHALVSYCENAMQQEPSVALDDFQAVPGAGVRARCVCDGAVYRIAVGNAALHAQGGDVSPYLAAFAERREREACTVVYVAVDGGAPVMAFALADALKPHAADAVEWLHNMGLHCSIMTGDTATSAAAVARAVGVPSANVHASLSPNGKLTLIERSRAAPEPDEPTSMLARVMNALVPSRHDGLAMVGDGVNDSPALATADVGVAMSSGSDVAVGAASIVLMRNDVTDVPAAFMLCQRIFWQIRLNFLWATTYNLVMVPLAMGFLLPWGIYLHPMMAGMAMACSSVSVVLSSLSLRNWTRPDGPQTVPGTGGWLSSVSHVWNKVVPASLTRQSGAQYMALHDVA